MLESRSSIDCVSSFSVANRISLNFHKSKALKYTKHSVKVFFFMLSFFTYGCFDNFKKKLYMTRYVLSNIWQVVKLKESLILPKLNTFSDLDVDWRQAGDCHMYCQEFKAGFP